MQGTWRRIVYIALYEGIAILLTSVGLLFFTAQGLGHSAALAIATSTIAVLWNLCFNWLFERWESRQKRRGRGLGRRLLHAAGFEGGLVLMFVPLMAWWLDISLLTALVADLGLVVFFFFYALVFNWGFDRVFGLPLSAT